jgi:hypothetical protein
VGGGIPCAVCEADCDRDGEVTGAADRSLTCDEVLARVGCSDVVELDGPEAPPPRRARFLVIMAVMFTKPESFHVEKGAVFLLVADSPGCLFGMVISCERPNQPLRNARRPADSPLPEGAPATPPRAPRYLSLVPWYPCCRGSVLGSP